MKYQQSLLLKHNYEFYYSGREEPSFLCIWLAYLFGVWVPSDPSCKTKLVNNLWKHWYNRKTNMKITNWTTVTLGCVFVYVCVYVRETKRATHISFWPVLVLVMQQTWTQPVVLWRSWPYPSGVLVYLCFFICSLDDEGFLCVCGMKMLTA